MKEFMPKKSANSVKTFRKNSIVAFLRLKDTAEVKTIWRLMWKLMWKFQLKTLLKTAP